MYFNGDDVIGQRENCCVGNFKDPYIEEVSVSRPTLHVHSELVFYLNMTHSINPLIVCVF